MSNSLKFRSQTYKFKKELLKNCDNKCIDCGSNKNLELHHTQYDIIDMNSMKILCRDCHSKLHKKIGKVSKDKDILIMLNLSEEEDKIVSVYKAINRLKTKADAIRQIIRKSKGGKLK